MHTRAGDSPLLRLLIGRFDADAQNLPCAQEPAAARNIAFCIAQLQLSDKALRRLAELWKVYHAALADPTVLSHFQASSL